MQNNEGWCTGFSGPNRATSPICATSLTAKLRLSHEIMLMLFAKHPFLEIFARRKLKKRRSFSIFSRSFFRKRRTILATPPLFFKVNRNFLSSPKEGRKHHDQKKNERYVNDSKNALLARTRTRALQEFLCFCFHNLHRFLCNSLLFNHLPPIFGQFLTKSKAQNPHQHSKTQRFSQHNPLTYSSSLHLLPLFRWRLWKQKVTTPWCAHTHARGFFWNVKMSIHIFPSSSVPYFPKAYCTFTTALLCPITITLSFFHYRTILFPRSSHSPSTFTPDKGLCFTCSLRPLSRNSEISTLQNEYTIK